MIKNIYYVFKRDFDIYFNNPSSMLNPLFSFLMILTVYSIGLLDSTAEFLPVLLWVAVILSVLLSIDFRFKEDYRIGYFEQILLSEISPYIIIFSKILALWIATCGPIVLVMPLISFIFGFKLIGIFAITLNLFIASLILCCLGTVCTAITAQLNNSSMLLIIISLPIYIPVIIFGVGGSVNAVNGLPFIGQVALLSAILINALVFSPVIIVNILRINLN